MKIVICPSSSGPVTFGHLDIINRTHKIFDHLIVAALVSPNKHTSFTVEERINMLRRVTADISSIEIVGFEGLLTDYAKVHNATVIVKGLRALSDFEYESQVVLTDKKLNPDLETLFLTIRAGNMYLSSNIVKQVASFDGDISNFVPECTLDNVTQRLYTGSKKR